MGKKKTLPGKRNWLIYYPAELFLAFGEMHSEAQKTRDFTLGTIVMIHWAGHNDLHT